MVKVNPSIVGSGCTVFELVVFHEPSPVSLAHSFMLSSLVHYITMYYDLYP